MVTFLSCLGIVLILLAVLFTPKWIRIICYSFFIEWVIQWKWGWGAVLATLVIPVSILVVLFWKSKEEPRHHSEKGTKFWE